MKKTKRQPNKKVVTEATGHDSTPIEIETKGNVPTGIEQADIDSLPASLKRILEEGTRLRVRAHLPDNLQSRTAQMVRRFRGDRAR